MHAASRYGEKTPGRPQLEGVPTSAPDPWSIPVCCWDAHRNSGALNDATYPSRQQPFSDLVFEYEGHDVRVAGTPESPLFVAADVCRVLGISNPSQAMARLDDDEHILISNEGASNGLPVHAVTESGLYSLILGSRKPEARAFKRWVTHEVLPAIRKTGRYAVNLSPAEQLLAQAQMLVEQERRQRELEVRTQAIELRVATVEQAGSESFLMELDPLYADVIVDRYQRSLALPPCWNEPANRRFR